MTNASGHNTKSIDDAHEANAYDRLPKAARLALANSAFKWSAKELEDYRKQNYLPASDVARFIVEQDKLMIKNQARQLWGREYLPIVRPDLA